MFLRAQHSQEPRIVSQDFAFPRWAPSCSFTSVPRHVKRRGAPLVARGYLWAPPFCHRTFRSSDRPQPVCDLAHRENRALHSLPPLWDSAKFQLFRGQNLWPNSFWRLRQSGEVVIYFTSENIVLAQKEEDILASVNIATGYFGEKILLLLLLLFFFIWSWNNRLDVQVRNMEIGRGG